MHGCAQSCLASFSFLGPEPDYSDPPCHYVTRRSARRFRFDYGAADRIAFLELFKALFCQVMVSGHPPALYDEVPAGERHAVLAAMMAVDAEDPRRCRAGTEDLAARAEALA